jgi:solute carrier family 25 S-adenosylmethionine transporter 26
MGQIPYGALTFSSYEIYKQVLEDRFPRVRKELRFVLAAMMADATGLSWLVPSEVVKQQLQGGLHASLPAAVVSIWRTSRFKGFYTGYWAQLARDVPFRAIQLPSYELFKALYTSGISPVRVLNAAENMFLGAIAGSLSAALTTPLDVVKTQLMTGTTGAKSVSAALSSALSLAREKGLSSLFAGVVPRVVYVGPSCAIFFMVYEGVRGHLNRQSNQESVFRNQE